MHNTAEGGLSSSILSSLCHFCHARLSLSASHAQQELLEGADIGSRFWDTVCQGLQNARLSVHDVVSWRVYVSTNGEDALQLISGAVPEALASVAAAMVVVPVLEAGPDEMMAAAVHTELIAWHGG